MTEKAQKRPWDGKWRCLTRVPSGSFRYSRCGNAAKHDPDVDGNPTQCGIHCSTAVAKRKQASDERYAKYRERQDRTAAHKGLSIEATAIVRQIAEGHNDPRALCVDWVERKDVLEATP